MGANCPARGGRRSAGRISWKSRCPWWDLHRGREDAGGDAAFELLQEGDGATRLDDWSFRVIDEAGIVTTSKELITCMPGVGSFKPRISRRLQTSSSAALP
jgi:hypothetical protein